MSPLEKLPSAWKAAIVLMSEQILKTLKVNNTEKALKELGVGRSTAYESARLLITKAQTPPGSLKEERKKNKKLQQELNEKSLLVDISNYERNHRGCWIQEGERQQFSEGFKIFVIEKKEEYALSWSQVSRLLGIPEDTLRKFKKSLPKRGGPGSKLKELPDKVRKLINKYLTSSKGKKSVKQFCEKHPEVLEELKMEYREVVSWLSHLGFVSPKGIFLKIVD